MDKETISEYGYIIIAIIVAVIVTFSLSSPFLGGRMKALVDQSVPETEQYEYENNSAYRDYINSKGAEE